MYRLALAWLKIGNTLKTTIVNYATKNTWTFAVVCPTRNTSNFFE